MKGVITVIIIIIIIVVGFIMLRGGDTVQAPAPAETEEAVETENVAAVVEAVGDEAIEETVEVVE